MKKWYLIITWVFCLVSFLLSGCAHVVKVEKPKLNMEETIAKLKPADTAKVFGDEKTIKYVGVLIELKSYAKIWRGVLYGGWRKEEEVYKMVSSKIMSSLEEAGISASLIYDESDPRLENISVLLHIEYSEDLRSGSYNPGGWHEAQAMMSFSSPTVHYTQIVDSYHITIYDIKTGNKVYYYKLEEAVNALGEKFKN